MVGMKRHNSAADNDHRSVAVNGSVPDGRPTSVEAVITLPIDSSAAHGRHAHGPGKPTSDCLTEETRKSLPVTFMSTSDMMGAFGNSTLSDLSEVFPEISLLSSEKKSFRSLRVQFPNAPDIIISTTEAHRAIDYSKLLSSTYAIMLILIGILFPLTEAVQDKWHETIYNCVYIVYTLSLSSAFLILLQLLLERQHRRHRKHDSSHSTDGHNSLPPSRRSSRQQHGANGRRRSSAAPDFNVRETRHGIFIEDDSRRTAGGADHHDDRESETFSGHHDNTTRRRTGVIRHSSTVSNNSSGYYNNSNGSVPKAPTTSYAKNGNTASTANGGISAKIRFGSVANIPTNTNAPVYGGGVASPVNYYTDPHLGNTPEWLMDNEDADGSQDQLQQEDEDYTWIDLSKLGNVFIHEGSSLYLRLGELIFAIGNVIYIALEIQFQLDPVTAKCSGTFSWTFYFRLVFILLQTFFLFKNPTMHIHERGAFVRFALAHLIATNLSVWLRTLANEIMNEYNHLNHNLYMMYAAAADPSSNSTGTTTNCHGSDNIVAQTAPYLFPFVLEYSLIASGTLALMWAEVEAESDERQHALRGIQNLFKVQALEKSSDKKPNDGDTDSLSSDEGILPTLTKSHRGLFAGILVLAGGFISGLLFYLDKNHNELTIYLVTDLSIHSLMLIAVVFALIQVHQLSYVERPVSVDDILLLLSLCGAVLYEVAVAMASGDYVANYQDPQSVDHPSNHSSHMSDLGISQLAGGSDAESTSLPVETLRLCSSLVACIQAVLQMLLTVSALRRYPSKQRHLAKMPGRGLITFLIIGNVTVWIFRSALIKALSPNTQLNYYGTISWLLLLNFSLPLLLFYRFHSSVCLADVWHTAYTSPFHSSGHSSSPAANTDHNSSHANNSSHSKFDGSFNNLMASANNVHGGGGHEADAYKAGVSTLLKTYSMPHLTPPRQRASVAHRVSQIGSNSKLYHIDDVEDVEDIDREIASTAAAGSLKEEKF